MTLGCASFSLVHMPTQQLNHSDAHTDILFLASSSKTICFPLSLKISTCTAINLIPVSKVLILNQSVLHVTQLEVKEDGEKLSKYIIIRGMYITHECCSVYRACITQCRIGNVTMLALRSEATIDCVFIPNCIYFERDYIQG